MRGLRRRMIGIGLFLLTASPGTVLAQDAQVAPTTPMTPSQPHERLQFFAGSWSVAEMPAEAAFIETCDWLEAGRRHMICRSTWQTATGERQGLSIFSYSVADSVYLYHGFRAGGRVQKLRGTVEADGVTWEFAGEEGSGAERVRTRVRIRPLPEGGFRLAEQTANGDGEWSAEDAATYNEVSD